MFGELPAQVALYFLESGIIGATAVKEGDLEEIKEKIRRVSAGLRRQDFPATPAYMACTYCAYNQICPCSFGSAPATDVNPRKNAQGS